MITLGFFVLRLALQVADVAVVTATRDGMNLVPYEYVVCRQGPPGWAEPGHKSQSMLVVSGGRPSVSSIWCAQHGV
jgi:trehalose-6-phosphate synthase